MKNSLKRIIAATLALIIAFGTVTMTTEAKTWYGIFDYYDSADDVAKICWSTYNKGQYGPIFIVQGELTDNGVTKPIYLVAMCGTELIEGQATGLLQDLYAGFQRSDNPYTRNVVKAIKEEIPVGSNLMLVGHSLGGMVAQMIASNDYVKANYEVLNTVTFGSPAINVNSREGKVQRLGDKSDFVPYMSVTINLINQFWGLNREDGGYQKGIIWTPLDGWNAHEGSYIRADVWGNYDVTGVKGGNATLHMKPETLIFKQSPVSWEQMIEMYTNN